ncbi:UNVERIFIED_CONTAM: hypothetical protein PYX00_001093 [Menopon gallinae]|uniref:Aquaporin n=1 Tax=Menopon gallinae TaxID=328185 RepID=A0AAW2ICQ8_9NEOP
MGNSAVAETVLTNGKGGNPVTVYVGYGIGLFLGILISGGVSGGHLNPAVTVAGAIVGKFKRVKVFHYLIAQYLGAFVAAAFTYLVYIDSFKAFHGDLPMNQTTASIFATYPKSDLSVIGSVIDQILGSMVLIFAIYAATDKKNTNVPPHLVSVYVTLTLIGIACSLGINQGFAVNPARDLSPRIFTYLAGWGNQVFSSETYWYVPIVGPHIGALIGALLYISLIEKLRKNEDDRFYLPPPEIKQFTYSNPVCE